MNIQEYLLEAKKEKKYEITKSTGKRKYKTDIPPGKRTFKNKPESIRFQDWFEIKKDSKYKGIKNYSTSWGKGCDGKMYGWSHRAFFGFKVGSKITKDTCGNWKKKEWTIKTEKEAVEMAIAFSRSVS